MTEMNEYEDKRLDKLVAKKALVGIGGFIAFLLIGGIGFNLGSAWPGMIAGVVWFNAVIWVTKDR